MSEVSTIMYTKTDEAPALATQSFLPIIRSFTKGCGVEFVSKDISLPGRILANFPEFLAEEQRCEDALTELGKLALTPGANIIKLPNISASIPQLTAAIAELRAKGFMVPEYPANPTTPEEEAIKKRFAKCLGSAVNPVLREGNSDRRVAGPVKEYARANPHSMGEWSPESKTCIASMEHSDFAGSEVSVIMPKADDVRIELVNKAGEITVLKASTPLKENEIIDSSCLSAKVLREFFAKQIEEAREKDVLLSIHMKATMMKVSDPKIFGHLVSVYFADLFAKHATLFKELGVTPTNGLGDVYTKIKSLSEEQQAAIKADIEAIYKVQPALAMVDSDKGITNLHVPSDVIIDASVPAFIRAGGKMWDAAGELRDTIACIPDRCYSGVFQATIDFCKKNGAFDVTTMGNVSNVGLMAKKAEEYGSHNKTFQLEEAGVVRVVNQAGETIMQHDVEVGDIWRMCQTQDVAVKDWVKLAVFRARQTGASTVFWLNPERAHDAILISKVNEYIVDHDTEGLDIKILDPVAATTLACERAKAGLDSVSVTGNVLRDYLTDLFPILELGSSSKMLSIVPLLSGGGLFETGAGGSAPKHVQQFAEEGHLRWESLGEFLALAVSLEDLGLKKDSLKIKVLAETLTAATSMYLVNKKAPGRKVHELDNAGSHVFLALYWAQAIAAQDKEAELKARFAPIAEKMAAALETVIAEYDAVQGKPVDMGGYYVVDEAKCSAAMRPSKTFNAIIESM